MRLSSGSSPAWRARGGDITGSSWLGTELPGKRLELLKELVPQSARIAVLANPANPYYGSRMHNLTGAAQVLGLHLHVVEVRHADELDPAFAAMPQAHADALLVMEDALVLSTSLRGRIPDLAATSRLPAMYGWREVVAADGLMSYGPSFQDIHRRAAGQLFIRHTLLQADIALEETVDGIWSIYFSDVLLGRLNAHALDSNPVVISQKYRVHAYAEGSARGDERRL